MMKWLVLLAVIVLVGSYTITYAASESTAKMEMAVFAVR
jgi:hypothetical protein